METSFRGSVALDAFLARDFTKDWQVQQTSLHVAEIRLLSKLFADSAPPKSGSHAMREMGLLAKIEDGLKDHAGWRSLGWV